MKKVASFVNNFEELSCAILLLIMLIIATINIIARYLPGVSFASSEELISNLFVWLTMLGAAAAVKQKAHIAISFLLCKIPAMYQKGILIIQWILISILFLLICYYSTIETWSEYKSDMMTYSLGWPIWIFTLALPVGSLIFLIRLSELTFKELKELE